MKKTVLLTALMAVFAICANAQLKIDNAGKVGIGDLTPAAKLEVKSTGAHYAGTPTLLVKDQTNRGTMILESVADQPTDFVFKNNGKKNIWLSSRDEDEGYSFNIYTNEDNVGSPDLAMSINQGGNFGIGGLPNNSYRLYLYGHARATGYWYNANGTSKNGEDIKNALSKIEKINGTTTVNEYKENGKLIQEASLEINVESLKNVFPELVRIEEGEEENIAVNYDGLIPVLVEAIKEQQGLIAEMKSEIESLRNTAAVNNMNASFGETKLYQNTPNPFSKDTEIKVNIDEDVNDAILFVYDMQGKQIKSIAINQKGESSITIYGSELEAGMYYYALVVDGKEVETKKMILTE